MAANLASLRAALVRMGTTAEVANEITVTQGIDTIDELCILTDDEVETLCRAIRRPGGLIPNPAFNAAGGAAAALAAGIPAQITNTGHVISARAENNIKLAAYFLRFKERTSRTPDAASITLANVRSLLDNGRKPTTMSTLRHSMKRIGHTPSKQLRNSFEVALAIPRKFLYPM